MCRIILVYVSLGNLELANCKFVPSRCTDVPLALWHVPDSKGSRDWVYNVQCIIGGHGGVFV